MITCSNIKNNTYEGVKLFISQAIYLFYELFAHVEMAFNFYLKKAIYLDT